MNYDLWRTAIPYKLARPCRYPHCPNLTNERSGFCSIHAPMARSPDRRPPSSRRGYNADWRRIRKQVLLDHGIPESEHYLYAVDHTPSYNPVREPDHTKYTLTPYLISDHNRKTAQQDGGFGNPKGGGATKSLQPRGPKPYGPVCVYDVSKDEGGS